MHTNRPSKLHLYLIRMIKLAFMATLKEHEMLTISHALCVGYSFIFSYSISTMRIKSDGLTFKALDSSNIVVSEGWLLPSSIIDMKVRSSVESSFFRFFCTIST